MKDSLRKFSLGIEPLVHAKAVHRLEGIATLGALHLVFPHQKQSRKEHSFEVMHMTAEWLSMQNNFTRDEVKYVVAHALLHDIGHTPYSHELERLARKNQKEMTYDLIMNNSLSSLVQLAGLDRHRLTQIVTKNDSLSSIVADKFGFDKIAYVASDSQRLGFGALESTDVLLQNISYNKNENILVLDSAGEEAAVDHAERYVDLHTQAYFHPASLANKRILTKIMYSLLKNDKENEDWQLWLDKDIDNYIIRAAQDNAEIATLWTGLNEGEYRLIHTFSPLRERKREFMLPATMINQLKSFSLNELHELEDNIGKYIGLSKGDIIFASNGNVEKTNMPDIVLKKEKKFMFKEAYPLFTHKKMAESRENNESIFVYANQNIEKAVPVIREYILHLLY